MGVALAIVILATLPQPDLLVDARLPEESTGTMHYAGSLRLQIGDAEPLTYYMPPVPLPGPHFRLPSGPLSASRLVSSIRIGIPEPVYWGGDPEMWSLDLGGQTRTFDFDAMHRLHFRSVVPDVHDVFYDGFQPAKKLAKRVVWIAVTRSGFAFERL